MMDEKDARILEILQRDGRETNVELARAVELTPSATLERVRKLEERGLIKGYTAMLDPHALGLGLVAFIFVRVDDREDVIGSRRRRRRRWPALPSVQELHHLAGEDCFLLKVQGEGHGRSLPHPARRVGAVQGHPRDADDDCAEDREGVGASAD